MTGITISILLLCWIWINKGDTILTKEQVENVLNKIKPSLQADGGDVELVEVGEDGIIKVKLKGACGSCPMSQMTLKMGIERILKEEVPEVKEVVAVWWSHFRNRVFGLILLFYPPNLYVIYNKDGVIEFQTYRCKYFHSYSQAES